LNGIDIYTGVNTVGNVFLSAINNSGTGTFNWTIGYPAGVTTATITISPESTSPTGTTSQTINLSNGVQGTSPLDSGWYDVTINLVNPTGKVVWKELLYIYRSLVSTYSFTFTSSHFTAQQYTVTFNSNSATSGSVPTVPPVAVGSPITIPGNTGSLVKTGYTFGGGWNTLADGSGTDYAAGATPTFNMDITLYAKWTPITYYVAYDSNGGTGSMSNSTHTYDVSANLSTNTFIRTGYDFAGWTANSDGTGTSYSNGQSVSNLTTTNGATVTLYAKWTAANWASGINLGVNQIEHHDPISASITLSRTSSPTNVNVTVTNDTDYDSITWEIAGTSVTGTGASFNIDATDTRYNTLGIHQLVVRARKISNGLWYQAENITFTIVP